MVTCLLFDFTQNLEQCWAHPVAIQSVFPTTIDNGYINMGVSSHIHRDPNTDRLLKD